MAAVEDNPQTYSYMENVLHKISNEYISVPENQIKRNNVILKEVLDKLLDKMKQDSVLFKSMYQSPYYGGSYYEGLKVGKPEEYDLDLLLKIPKLCNCQVLESDRPGFVYLQLPEFEKLQKQPEGVNYKELVDFMDNQKFLLMTKMQQWMESNLNKVLNSFKGKESVCMIPVMLENKNKIKFEIKLAKNGPAVTLKIKGNVDDEKVEIAVDLVIAFIFQEDKWPKGAYRQNLTTKKSFHVIPKAPKKAQNPGRYWRISFPEQEKHLASGFGRMKPVIRMLKRFRDHQKHNKIASYYIKTIFLWEIVDGNSSKSTWEGTLSQCFMKGLDLYEQRLREQNIPFFWNERHNLLENIKAATLVDIANQIKALIKETEKRSHDPFVVARYLVSDKDFLRLKDEVPVGKKHLKEYHKQELIESLNSSCVLFMNESISLEETSKDLAALTISDEPAKLKTTKAPPTLQATPKRETTPTKTASANGTASEAAPTKQRGLSLPRDTTPSSKSGQFLAREATPSSESGHSLTREATPVSETGKLLASVITVDAASAKPEWRVSERKSVVASYDENEPDFSRESSDSGLASDCVSLRVLQRLERKMDVMLNAMADFADRLGVVERKVDDLGDRIRPDVTRDNSNRRYSQ